MSGPSTSYSAVARLLHWLLAFLLLSQFIGGWLMTHDGLPEGFLYKGFQLHKSFGFVILALSLFRLFWRLGHNPPALPAHMKPWEHTVSAITHWLFYGVMIAIPLTGWIYVSAATEQIPTRLFFTLPIPHLPVPVSAALAERFSGFHEFLAFAMLGLFGLHVAAAAKHHVIEKDDVIPRMAGRGRWPSVIALGFAGIMAAALLATMLRFSGEEDAQPPEASATEAPAGPAPGSATAPSTEDSPYSWTILPDETHLDVTVFTQSALRHARIDGIRGQIILDPEAPEAHGRIDILIDTRSLASDENMVKEQASADGWLNTGRYPEARFQSDTITRTGGDHYLAEGTLTLKEITTPLSFDFSLTLDGPNASAAGTALFDRSVFGIGMSDTEDVTVTTDIYVGAVRNE